MFPRAAKHRNTFLYDARATNYGVVRLELIEHLYERMYDQKRHIGPDEKQWPHRILGAREITDMKSRSDGGVDIKVRTQQDVIAEGTTPEEEVFHADLVIAATGYQRTAHVDMLKGAWDLLPQVTSSKGPEYRKGIQGWSIHTKDGERNLSVGRDYRVKFNPGTVAPGSGVWLQGCCEGTHGVSFPSNRNQYGHDADLHDLAV